MDEHGQASPKETPLIWVRVDGQTAASPLVRTVQSVGMVMIGTDEARVDGWDKR
jgi:hypothetical protein